MSLAKLKSLCDNSEICIDSPEFSVGRSISNSYTIKDMSISRCHFTLKQRQDGTWMLTDKSTYGTRVNSKRLSKDEILFLQNGDIIELSEAMKYQFDILPDYVPTKRRRIQDDSETVNLGNTVRRKDRSPLVDSAASTTRSLTGAGESSSNKNLNNELMKLKKENYVLQEMNRSKVNKLLDLEVDLFNKTTTNVVLEQENEELRGNCVNLEKEKEELLSQVLDLECEVTLLKMKLEKKGVERTEVGKTREDSCGEDRKLINCVINAEILEKEFLIRSKIAEGIDSLKIPRKTHKSIIRSMLSQLQKDMAELAAKRSELNENERAPADTDGLKDNMLQLMEAELQCSVCNEYFIKPTALNCKHTFCKACILRWRRQKNSCPVCRMPIRTISECLSLDAFIDQALYALSPAKQEARLKLKQTYEESLNGLPRQSAASSSGSARTQARFLSSSSDSDSEYEVLDSWEEMDDDDYEHDYSDVFYGGYGNCYICGQSGHWANGCPRRRHRR